MMAEDMSAFACDSSYRSAQDSSQTSSNSACGSMNAISSGNASV
jgi:hypothetical protein